MIGRAHLNRNERSVFRAVVIGHNQARGIISRDVEGVQRIRARGCAAVAEAPRVACNRAIAVGGIGAGELHIEWRNAALRSRARNRVRPLIGRAHLNRNERSVFRAVIIGHNQARGIISRDVESVQRIRARGSAAVAKAPRIARNGAVAVGGAQTGELHIERGFAARGTCARHRIGRLIRRAYLNRNEGRVFRTGVVGHNQTRGVISKSRICLLRIRRRRRAAVA